ncbi:MAG: hypothetical protein KIT33_11390 [Candidatus Kapabacteria bacterium]|nr:hypothetical protein [Ignavibacteriota bacterium]MCW5885562.1 hypothetical protein [Candidatus Kapabacteria bacterium]
MNSFAVLKLMLLFVILSLSACSSDNATDNTKNDNNNNSMQPALAENNTMVSDGDVINLKQIGIFHQSFLNELWLFIDGDKSNTGFNVIIKNPFPEKSDFRFYFRNNFLGEIGEQYFIESLRFSTTNISRTWYSVGDAFNIETEGFMYFKRNPNNTISMWVNKLKLGDKKQNPSEFKEFNLKFTFNADIEITTNANPPRFQLISDK